MKVLNFIYENDELLNEKLNSFSTESNLLIQIFCGSRDRRVADSLIKNITTVLPQAQIVLTSSCAEICDGAFYEEKIALSISVFQKTTIKSQGFEGENVEEVANQIIDNLVSDDTKLLLVFGNAFKIDTKGILEVFSQKIPNVIIAGGNAADDMSFDSIFVGTQEGLKNFNVVCASLNSKDLQVKNDYILGYKRIGLDMTITDCSSGGIVHTINNKPVLDIYKRYLGQYVSNTLPINGYEFPLTFYEDEILIARTAIIKLDDNSLVYAGDIKKGTKVKFGVVSSLDAVKDTHLKVASISMDNIDAVYAFSCASRYLYFKDTVLKYNIRNFNNLAPMGGFFGGGEYFHANNKNYIFNNAATFVTLNEGISEEKSNTIHELEPQPSMVDAVIYGLSNLSSVSNTDYLEMVAVFKQYKDLLEKSLMVIYINLDGKIINVNEYFLSISKYKREEILGKKFAYIVSDDTNKIANKIWETIKVGKTWIGNLKNKSANRENFYTKTIIKPITDNSNNVVMYMCTMDDITELEIKKMSLENSVNVLTEVSLEKDNVIKKYQLLLDRSTAMIRLQDDRFIEVNKSCESIFGYSAKEMLDKHITLILKPNKDSFELIKKVKAVIQNKGYVTFYANCVDKNNKPLYIQFYLMGINKVGGDNYGEIVGILHDVTELFNMQQELEDVQKEVLYAMGTISEGRSRETGNHIKRVAEYTYILANLYGLDKKQAELLKIASPMHDIGKLAIPDEILNKPGKLTDEEFDEMKTHAQKGYEMLCFSNRIILKTAAEIALTHHEWWNGNGYPNKLKGEEIPLSGRIVAVADVFDALSHDRCYKKAWPINEVVEHMIKNKDIQFEGKLIDLLVDNLDEFLKIKTEYQDKFE
ncbi:MAG: PAS domain-containing protein [Helicobacteraceae bacterium]|nr:PAS domain-containing protein [Helicobacteraceae bacterium]